MFFKCNNKDFKINDNVNLPIDETLLNLDSINTIETIEMFLGTNINYIPKMFNGNDNIVKKCKKLAYKYSFVFTYGGMFKSVSVDLSVDTSIHISELTDDYQRMLNVEGRCSKIRYKFDDDDTEETAHINQISALVQEITPGSPSGYFIYPRYAGDDLIYNKIFLKHPAVYTNSSGLYVTFSNSQYLTRLSDYEYKIIFEDLSQSNLKEYDYKKFITTYNNSYSGMTYVENSYNEVTKTFRLKYEHTDGKIYETIYPFYSMFPIGYVTEDSATIIPIEIKNYSNFHDCWRNCNYLPIEEVIRYNLHSKNFDIGYNLPKSSIRIFPNEKIHPITFTYTDIKNVQQTKTFEVSDYYQKLHLHRNDAIPITDPNHINASCTSYSINTFDKIFLENEPYTENDPPIRSYLKNLVLTESGYTLGLTGLAKMLKEKTNTIVTNLGGLGRDYTAVTYVPKNFVIPDGVSNLNYLFSNTKITALTNPLILPSSVNEIQYLFYNTTTLEDVSNLDGSNANIKNAQLAFSNCYNLTKLPKLKFYSGTHITLNDMFNHCKLITEYPLTTINIPENSYVDLANTFANNTALTKIPEGLRNLSSSSSYAFSNCINLTTIPSYAQKMFTRSDRWYNTDKTSVLSYIFNGCSNLKSIDSSIQLPETINNYSGFFAGCENLQNIPETFWPNKYDTDAINLSNVCNNCKNLLSYIPSEKLWENIDKQWNYINAFKNCTKILNYTEIPETWK